MEYVEDKHSSFGSITNYFCGDKKQSLLEYPLHDRTYQSLDWYLVSYKI